MPDLDDLGLFIETPCRAAQRRADAPSRRANDEAETPSAN